MVQLNLALREINCKIVYFGPGLSGKTTNLEIVHRRAPEPSKGELTSIATESDRTLFFDFMPLNLGKVGGMQIKFQLYTVPGQVYYNSTRKLVLRGADGVVFVADSQPEKMEENIESLDNLEDCLREQGRILAEMPHIIQWNKRDLPRAMPVEEMARVLNRYGAPSCEAVAHRGDGVIETIKELSALVLNMVKRIAPARGSRGGARGQGPGGSGGGGGAGVGTPAGTMPTQPAASPARPPLPVREAATIRDPVPSAVETPTLPASRPPSSAAPPRVRVSPIAIDPMRHSRRQRTTGSSSHRMIVSSSIRRDDAGWASRTWLIVGAAIVGAVGYAFVRGLT